MPAVCLRATCALALLLPVAAQADAPAFDRPGISFAPSVLPRGSFDWEQGAPDMQRDTSAGIRTTVWMADTELRFGLGGALEFQIAGALSNQLDVSGGGLQQRAQGAGDTRLSLKWAPALSAPGWSLGVLGGVTLATGAPGFSSGRSVYSLGAVLGHDLGGGRSLGAYANLDHADGADTWTTAANFGAPIKGTLGGFVEIGHVSGGGMSTSVAGAGLTWLLHDRLQFDVYGRRGLSSASPDLQAGLGVSLFWN